VIAFRSLLLAGLVAGSTGACQSTTEPLPVVDYCARIDSIRPTLFLSAPMGSPRYEEILASRAIPGGYGGRFSALGGQLFLVLRDTTQSSAARAALAEAVGCGALVFEQHPSQFLSARIQLGRYDAEQLIEFGDVTSGSTGNLGACLVGVSWPDNGVVVWVPDEAHRVTVQAAAEAAGVPSDALFVEVRNCPSGTRTSMVPNPHLQRIAAR
jgi:hypothetical protein